MASKPDKKSRAKSAKTVGKKASKKLADAAKKADLAKKAERAKKAIAKEKQRAKKLAAELKKAEKEAAKKLASRARKVSTPKVAAKIPAPQSAKPDDSWTVVALRAHARSAGLTGYSRLSKVDLIKRLNTK